METRIDVSILLEYVYDDFGVNSHLIKHEAILVGVPISTFKLHLFGVNSHQPLSTVTHDDNDSA